MPVTTGLQTVGFGSNTKISYLVQAAAGAIDATPTWIVVPFASGEMTVQAEQMNDNSMTGDRNELEPRSGTVNGQMKLSGKFRPECLDGLIEAAAQGTWAAKYTEALGASVTVAVAATGKTFTRSEGSWIETGVEVGDLITFSGFTVTGPPDETANNGTFLVSGVTATVITCATATGLVDTASPQASVTVTTAGEYLKVGSTQRRVAWEIYHSDIDEYLRMVDTEISNFSLSLNANGEITFDMTAIGGTELDLGANIGEIVSGATYTETSKPFYDTFNGTISLEGATGIYFSSMTPTINNQSTPLFAIGSRYPFAISHGKMMGDMSLTAYYTDETIKSKYQDETSLNLKVQIKYEDEELIDTDFHEIEFPSTKIISFGRPVSGAGELVDNLTVKPYKDATLASSFRIRKYNAA